MLWHQSYCCKVDYLVGWRTSSASQLVCSQLGSLHKAMPSRTNEQDLQTSKQAIRVQYIRRLSLYSHTCIFLWTVTCHNPCIDPHTLRQPGQVCYEAFGKHLFIYLQQIGDRSTCSSNEWSLSSSSWNFWSPSSLWTPSTAWTSSSWTVEPTASASLNSNAFYLPPT